MKKLIPFRKEISFDNLYEVTSISLEHHLSKENNTLSGNFIVSGEYLATENSREETPFNYDLPFTIDIDDIYDISLSNIDIDDFYYEIINNKLLGINITVKLDNIKEVLIERDDTINLDDRKSDINISDNNIEINNIDDEIIIGEDVSKSIFSNLDNNDCYVNYRVYIVRDGDTLDTILNKYSISKDMLESYNDISSIKIGDKIIIPYVKN